MNGMYYISNRKTIFFISKSDILMLSPDKIGPAIRSLRESRGYSQEFMADQLNIAQSTYACLESGKHVLRVDRLIEIMEILETDPMELFHLDPQVAPAQLEKDKPGIHPEVKEVYEKLICEMKDEIAFLKDLIRSSAQVKQ
jgi:transcriptional regulator with XRE-family HTH domain